VLTGILTVKLSRLSMIMRFFCLHRENQYICIIFSTWVNSTVLRTLQYIAFALCLFSLMDFDHNLCTYQIIIKPFWVYFLLFTQNAVSLHIYMYFCTVQCFAFTWTSLQTNCFYLQCVLLHLAILCHFHSQLNFFNLKS